MNGMETTDLHTEKNNVGYLHHTRHKNQFQVDSRLDYEKKIIKLTEDNIREHLSDLGIKKGLPT